MSMTKKHFEEKQELHSVLVKQIVDLIRETCREENVALVMVTHTAEIRAQFDRVDELSDINQVEHSVV